VQNDTNLIGGYYTSFRSYGLNATTLGIESKWTMYTIVASGGVSNCYINDGSIVGNSIPYNESGQHHWTIGTYTVPGSQPFGHVATASIYDRALSVNEIKQNYETFKGRYGL
jgi:hypothetical protein